MKSKVAAFELHFIIIILRLSLAVSEGVGVRKFTGNLLRFVTCCFELNLNSDSVRLND